MTLKEFVREHAISINEHVYSVCPNCAPDLEELEYWVMNDESLYNWALSEGVKDI